MVLFMLRKEGKDFFFFFYDLSFNNSKVHHIPWPMALGHASQSEEKTNKG